MSCTSAFVQGFLCACIVVPIFAAGITILQGLRRQQREEAARQRRMREEWIRRENEL